MSMMILDGGMGRELKAMGAPFKQPEWSALALMDAPHTVIEAHDNFIIAGADMVTVNSYALVPFHIGWDRFNTGGRDLIRLAARLARECADKAERDIKVAGCIPPLFGSYEPEKFDAQTADDVITPLIDEQAKYVDFWLIETTSAISEAEFAIKHIKENEKAATKPIWISYTLTDRDNHENEVSTIRVGETTQDAASFAHQTDGVEAILFNCSEPEEMEEAITISKQVAGNDLKIGCYANSFAKMKRDETKANEGHSAMREEMTPEAYLNFAKTWKNAGANMVGGCCGIRPAHIKALSDNLR